MNKIYKIVLIFLLLLLFLSNIAFFAYGGDLLAYFKIDLVPEDPQTIIERAEDSSRDSVFFDLSLVESEKFNNLVDFNVDFNDFSVPDDLLVDNGGGTNNNGGPSSTDFEVGNTNPFKAPF